MPASVRDTGLVCAPGNPHHGFHVGKFQGGPLQALQYFGCSDESALIRGGSVCACNEGPGESMVNVRKLVMKVEEVSMFSVVRR